MGAQENSLENSCTSSILGRASCGWNVVGEFVMKPVDFYLRIAATKVLLAVMA